MIRKFLPPFVLILVASIFALTAVGALAGAAAVWLSRYWGLGWALFAVALGFLLLSVLAFVGARVWGGVAARRSDPLGDTVEGLWKAHPAGIMAAAAFLVFLTARKPGFIGRMFSAATKSTGLAMLLRRLL